MYFEIILCFILQNSSVLAKQNINKIQFKAILYEYESYEVDFKLYKYLTLEDLTSINVLDSGPAQKSLCHWSGSPCCPVNHYFSGARSRMASPTQKRCCQKLRSC